MVGVLLAILCLVALVATVRRIEPRATAGTVIGVLVVAYLTRLGFSFLLDSVRLFSEGNGTLRGDSQLYQLQGNMIAAIWRNGGLQAVDPDLIPQFSETTLPGYTYGFIDYLNGGDTLLGCVALVATLACFTCFNLYRLAVGLGADPEVARKVMTVTLFTPGFLLFTSDSTKDGLVAFFITAALGSAFRLTRGFSLGALLLGVLSLFALWFTRFYLVFAAVAPLAIGLQGLRSRSLMRPVMTLLVALVVMGAVAGYTDAFHAVTVRAQAAFDRGSDANVLASNATGGSGVTFDDGGNPYGALHLKLLYTVFAPFPWATGSIGFQIAKIDTFAWYYVIYRAYRTVRTRLRTEPVLMAMFASFIVPLTIAYATSVANVGLIYRQRIPIVLMVTVLACMSWPAAKKQVAPPRGATARPPPWPFRPALRRAEAAERRG